LNENTNGPPTNVRWLPSKTAPRGAQGCRNSGMARGQ